MTGLTLLLSRLLVQRPKVLSKLRCEIRDTLGVGPEAPIPSISQIKALPYLQLVVKEGMRRWPHLFYAIKF